jgi:predicted AlkP superfamily pyrophosphatase or phosphodiesterase
VQLMRFLILLVLCCVTAAQAKRNRLVIWSIDGFAAGYLTNPDFQKSAVWQRLLRRGKVFAPVETTIPSVTYPAHTAMMTGVDTATHRLYSNHPVDPFNLSKDGWTWYSEDVQAKFLWDLAREQGKSVANIMWPVTMLGAGRIKYHIPQFDRAKGPEEIKLMRVLSTPGLHREIEAHTHIQLNEHSGDSERIRAGKYIWKKKNPDIMLMYNPGLDTLEHGNGAYSPVALAHLDYLGREIELFLKEQEKLRTRDRTAVLIVSDHGFMAFHGKCHPNAILKSMGYIDPAKHRWQYVFDTAGGVARLVANNDAPVFKVKAFGEELARQCPDIDLVEAGHEDFAKLRSRYDAKARVFLVGRANVLMSAAWNKEVFNADATGHTHGFLPDRPDMHTLAIAFTPDKKSPVKISQTKDTFRFACSWLKLKCPKGKRAAR